MHTEIITYEDYNGETRTEEFMFNLNTAELTKLRFSRKGGIENYLKSVLRDTDEPKLMEFFSEILGTAYGKKSPDGRRFEKSPEIRAEFEQTEAYAVLFEKLFADNYAQEFIIKLLPKKVQEQIAKEAAEGHVDMDKAFSVIDSDVLPGNSVD